MKNKIENNYEWFDIIEPDIIPASTTHWEYLVIILFTLGFLFIINNYFNIVLRIQLSILKFNLNKNKNVKAIANQLISLFKFNQGTQYLESKLGVNISICSTYRLQVLELRYSNALNKSPTEHNSDFKNISQLLTIPVEWL